MHNDCLLVTTMVVGRVMLHRTSFTGDAILVRMGKKFVWVKNVERIWSVESGGFYRDVTPGAQNGCQVEYGKIPERITNRNTPADLLPKLSNKIDLIVISPATPPRSQFNSHPIGYLLLGEVFR